MVDTHDLKSCVRKSVPVRVRSGAPEVQQDKAERRLTFRTDEFLFSILSDISNVVLDD